MVPLGYESKGRKITVNEAEADRVRDIFGSYLKLGSPICSWTIYADGASSPKLVY
jgi:hypothetical protein